MKPSCSIEGCDRPSQAHGWCQSHYMRVRRTGSPGSNEIGARYHGLKDSPEYISWSNMRTRCLCPNAKSYQDYGARGITIDPAWDSFLRFYADMGPRPKGNYSLDRIDNDGPYAPENCRWADRSTQNSNQRPRRLRETCRQGHAFTPENTIWWAGGRRCRICRLASDAKRRARKRQLGVPRKGLPLVGGHD